MTASDRRLAIDLPVAERLFSLGDATPFDADYDCITGMERLIEEVARLPDLGARGATITLGLGRPGPDEATLRAAIGRYCRAEAGDKLRLAEGKKREGIQTLLLSGVFVAATLVLVLIVDGAEYFSPMAKSLLSHGLVIAAWVALWRPLDLLLYEPWLLRREARILSAIEAMPLEVVSRGAPGPSSRSAG
jgi:hypothetical protein